MKRHLLGRTSELPPGSRRVFEVEGRAIAVFNVRGEYFAILDRCPHEGGSLAAGCLTGLVEAEQPGSYVYSRAGEMIRCPWHGWEFDIRTGQSWCDPRRIRVPSYPVETEPGARLVQGPYSAETFPVDVSDEYLFVLTKTRP